MKQTITTITLILLLLIAACSSSDTPEPEQPSQPEQPEQPTVEVQAVAPTDTPVPTPTLTPTPTPEPIAPIIISTAPERGQEQQLDTPLEIVFDQPMDRDSVERAFAIEPGASVDGSFTWPDDRTLHFTLNDGFQRGQRYKVRLIESATSAVGLAMQRPFEMRFSTVGFLEVTNVSPAAGSTEILPDTIITVLFNRPVVPLNAIEDAASLPDPLTFVPPVRGQGEWLNTSIYQFTPADDDGFEPATAYQARIGQGLTDVLGNATLEDDFEWSFSTVMPAVIASNPSGGDIYVAPNPIIKLAFNQPMDHPSVEENFQLIDLSTNQSIPGNFTWLQGGIDQPLDEADFNGYYDYKYDAGDGPEVVGVETVAFTPAVPLDFETIYRLQLPRGTQGAISRAETERNFNADFTITPYPQIVSTYPTDSAKQISPWQSLEITFNAPMNPDSLVFGDNLFIEPTVSVTQVYTYWWKSDTNVEINFPTKASSAYKVTLGSSIEGRYGHQLGNSTDISWETRAESPMLYMHNPGRVAMYNAYTDTLAYFTVRNLSNISFELYTLPKVDFIRLNGDNWWESWDAYNQYDNEPLAVWRKEITPPLNKSIIYGLDLGVASGLGDQLPPGLYYLEANAYFDDVYDEAKGADQSFSTLRERVMLVVSKHNITLKATSSEALAWLTNLQDGQPVAGVPLTFELDRQSVEEQTNSDGVASITYQSPSDDLYLPHFAFAGDPDEGDDDFAVAISNWTDGIDRYQFDNVSTEDYQQPYNAHFYTDRNIYRPGQSVHFKGILRQDDDARYALPTANNSASVTISDSQGKEIFAQKLKLSQMGTINGSFELDENAALGFYSIQVQYDGDNYFYDDFQVAAYRKPEFLVSVETDKPEYVQGDKVQVTALAEFFFGGPVSNAEVRWTLVSNDYAFNYSGKGFYDFTDYDSSRSNYYYSSFGETLAEGEGFTDAEGRLTFEVEADIAAKITSQRFTFDIAITDLNNQEVASQADVIIHKGLFYIGLRPNQYVARANEETGVKVLLVDWDSEPVAGQEVELVFAEHNWYSVQRQYEDGSYYWDSYVESVAVHTTTVTSDNKGQAIASFTPTTGGIYRVQATGSDNRPNEIKSSTFMWVSGSQYVNWRQENNDRLELVTDQREYSVGDTATILVPHPYSGTVQALVTLERGHLYEHFVTELKTNSDQLQIPITEDMVPNMYVSVVVVKGVDAADTLPSFKVGYASLPIDISEKELQITLTPNKSDQEAYQPGETAAYFMNVTTVHGEPIKAELSLALVDKAVLSLAPEIPGQLMDTFWRNRGLGVRTGSGLTLAIDRINLKVAPEAKGGGGGGFDEGFGVIRGDFKDTALWIADFTTDKNGEGTVEAQLPDNLTTWTMTAKGVSGAETFVGEARVEIVSTKPLLVRPVAPRFFVVGDEALMGLIVQNNSQQTLDIEARFTGEGLTLGDWRIGTSANGAGQVGEWQSDGEPMLTIEPGQRVKIEYNVTVEDVEQVALTMGAKSDDYGDALTIELPVYRFSTPETVATAGILEEDGLRTEGIALPQNYDPTQGDLTIHIDPSLAAGMRDGLNYLEHFRYECTEQTVSRFLPNVFTHRAYQQLNMSNPDLKERLPGLVSVGLQRLYNQQHFDGWVSWRWQLSSIFGVKECRFF